MESQKSRKTQLLHQSGFSAMFGIPHKLLYKLNTSVCVVQIYPTSTWKQIQKIIKVVFYSRYCRQWKRVHNEITWSNCYTWRFDSTVEGNGWLLLLPNHSGWPLPCRLSQFLNANTKRSACVGVKVRLVYCLLMSPPFSVSARKIFSWPWSTIMSPSYTLFEVQCSYHLGTTWDMNKKNVRTCLFLEIYFILDVDVGEVPEFHFV